MRKAWMNCLFLFVLFLVVGFELLQAPQFYFYPE